MEFRKAYTDKKGHVFHTNYWVKKKDRFPLQDRLRQERLGNWKLFLVNEYQSIEICHV